MTDTANPDSKPEQAGRDKGGRWRKGTSGNPGGRAGEANRLRAQIAEAVPAIIENLTAQALAGDVQACRLLLERCLPALKSEAQTVEVPGMAAGSLTERAQAILTTAAGGNLSPDTAAQLVAAVGALARVVEISELEERIAALEAGR